LDDETGDELHDDGNDKDAMDDDNDATDDDDDDDKFYEDEWIPEKAKR